MQNTMNNTHADRVPETKSRAVANTPLKQASTGNVFAGQQAEAVAQGTLQQIANNSPQVKQLKVVQAMADNHTSAKPLQKKESHSQTNNTGLPDQLKTGIESLSGISMNQVKVHYGSSQPAQLNALAYAQGSEIHIAPGQEKHLPHEAWHLGQQAQGRVQPTMQLKAGLAVNDDTMLEREADVMGTKAETVGLTQLKQKEDAPPAEFKKMATGTLQRRVLPFETRSAEDELVIKWKSTVEQFVSGINHEVEQARSLACNWQSLQADGGYIGQWITAADTFFKNPSVAPPFIHARFGYAIETLACNNLPEDFKGLTVHKQFTAGSTRPDLVLRDTETEEQIAWIDITAEASAGHIRGKDGGGWKTRPFVCEILYNSLDLKEILGGNSPVLKEVGDYLANRAQVSEEEKEKQKIRARNVLIELREKTDWQTGYGNAKEKMEITKDCVEKQLGINLGDSWKKNLKGLLAWVEVNDGPYGFNTYGGGQSAETAKTWGNEKAKSHIEKRHTELDAEEKQDTKETLDMDEGYDEMPFVLDYNSKEFESESHKAVAGIAVRVAAPVLLNLQKAYIKLQPYQTGVGDLSEFAEEVEEHIKQVPHTAHVLDLNAWVNEASPYIESTAAMIRAHEALKKIAAIATHFENSGDKRAEALVEKINKLEKFPAGRKPSDLDEWADETEGIPEYATLLNNTLTVQQQFQTYLAQKYRTAFHLFARTLLESTILMKLDEDPKDGSVITGANNYMQQNALV